MIMFNQDMKLLAPRYINVSVRGLLNPPAITSHDGLWQPQQPSNVERKEKIKKQLDVLEIQGYTVVIDTAGVNNMQDMSDVLQKIIDW